METSPSHRVVSLPGKGEGLIATRDIAAGTLIVDEAPIVVLDPPTKRKDLLMLLGCRLFSTIDMRTTPDNIRSETVKCPTIDSSPRLQDLQSARS